MNRILSIAIPLAVLIVGVALLILEATPAAGLVLPARMFPGEYRGPSPERVAWEIEERDGIPHEGTVADPATLEPLDPFGERP